MTFARRNALLPSDNPIHGLPDPQSGVDFVRPRKLLIRQSEWRMTFAATTFARSNALLPSDTAQIPLNDELCVALPPPPRTQERRGLGPPVLRFENLQPYNAQGCTGGRNTRL